MKIFKIFNVFEEKETKSVTTKNHETVELTVFLKDGSEIYWEQLVKNEEEKRTAETFFKSIINDINWQLSNLDRTHLVINKDTVVMKSEFSHATIYGI